MDKYTKIKRFFEQKKDEENADCMSKYMRYLFKFYGLSTPIRKEVYKDLLKEEKKSKNIDWEFLDKVLGNIGLKDNRVDALMIEWSKDDDFWVRRIAINYQLCRKEKTNAKLLETIIVNNLGSNEFFINKAIGWSLRDYSKTNPKWVRNFINKYKDKMDKLSIKEASKYI